MPFLSRTILAILFFLIAYQLSLITHVVHAEGEFDLSYKTRYTIIESGEATVQQDIVLKNQTANFYADKFELKIGSTKVRDVKASDETGALDATSTFENNITTISVKFKQRVIGQDKVLPWKLSYVSNELATKSGQIWEISIPRLAKSTDITDYMVTVSVPRSFGPAAFALPKPLSQLQAANGQEFTYNKDQLLDSGIAMSFGEKQVFSFKLNYYLENKNVTSQNATIALPPDNNYQKIVLEKIDPAPLDIDVDADGNFIAKYKLAAKEEKNITATGYVEVFSKPFRNIYPRLTDAQKSLYTQPQAYWETDSAAIRDKAKEIKDPKNIYDFVSNYLTYNDARVSQPQIERKGAASAYASPKDAICMEFTDLFIAIARAAGIPAREVEGYAYTQNERLRPLSLTINQGDILHAWPEYWDDQLGWVQIDPTWASTSGGLDYFNKLDFNHITFVQRGVSSTKPYPAGSYKPNDQLSQKSVFVEFAKDLPFPTSTPVINLTAKDRIFSGIPLNLSANIKNTGTTSIIGQNLLLSSSKLAIKSPNPIDIDMLPPFASKTYNFKVETAKILKSDSDTLVLSFAQTQISKQIKIEPLYRLVFTQLFIISITSAVLIISIGLTLYKKVVTHTPKPGKLKV